MTAEIIDGKAFAAGIREQVRVETQAFREETGIQPGLAVVLVGDDPASEVYVRNKHKQSEQAGFLSKVYHLPADITQQTLLEKIDELNHDTHIHGILVQLPLPKQLNVKSVLEAIDPDKDVDGFHPINVGRLWAGEDCVVPCTPLGCSLILEKWVGKSLAGKNAVMIGASNIVGKPMAAMLLRMGATVTIAHSYTRDVAAHTRQADIVVVATGVPNLVKKDWIKPGAVVLDVGISRIKVGDGTKLVGDVDFAAVKEVASAITPVPGGVGPMTIACLLKNTLHQAKLCAVQTA